MKNALLATAVLLAACSRAQPIDNVPQGRDSAPPASENTLNSVNSESPTEASTRNSSNECLDEDGNPLPGVSNPCLVDANSERARALWCQATMWEMPTSGVELVRFRRDCVEFCPTSAVEVDLPAPEWDRPLSPRRIDWLRRNCPDFRAGDADSQASAQSNSLGE